MRSHKSWKIIIKWLQWIFQMKLSNDFVTTVRRSWPANQVQCLPNDISTWQVTNHSSHRLLKTCSHIPGLCKEDVYVSVANICSHIYSRSFMVICFVFLFMFNYISFIMVLLHCPNYFPLASLHSANPTISGNAPNIVHAHGSGVLVIWLLHFLYYTLHSNGYSVTTYLYFLIPSPPHPLPYTPLPSDNHQNAL